MTETDLEEKSLRNMVSFFRYELVRLSQGLPIPRNTLQVLKKKDLIRVNYHDIPAHFELTTLAKRLLGVT